MHVDADLHAAAVTAIDAAVGGLGGNDELGLNAVLVVDVLPAHAVAVLFLDGADDHDLVALGDKTHVLHHLGSIGSRSHAALLVGAAAAVDDLVGLVALIGIGIPVLDVADADGVDVGVDGDDLVALAHKAHDVAQAVDLDLVIAKVLHLGLDTGNNLALLAGLRGMANHCAKKTRHISTVGLSSVFNCLEIEFLSHNSQPFYKGLPTGGFLSDRSLVPSSVRSSTRQASKRRVAEHMFAPSRVPHEPEST